MIVDDDVFISESRVDELRNEHDHEEHWELKRKFLLAHRTKFTLRKLKCLSQTYFNIEVLGCRYPPETMEQIAELAAAVPGHRNGRQCNGYSTGPSSENDSGRKERSNSTHHESSSEQTIQRDPSPSIINGPKVTYGPVVSTQESSLDGNSKSKQKT